MLKTTILAVIFLLTLPTIQAQQIDGELTLEQAIGIAITQNYDLKIAEQQLQQAKNNNSRGNAGLLPSVSLAGGVDYANTNSETQTETSGLVQNNGIGATGYNGAARIDYTLFDGFGNRYYYKKLKQSDEQQQTIFRQQMENTMLSVVKGYYRVCITQQNLKLAKESMKISKDRYQKVLDRRTYGQANKLDVLNAEVDMNSDSTLILNTEQNFIIAIKNLNVILGIPVNTTYSVDEKIEFSYDLTAEQVVSAAMLHNTMLQSQQIKTEISDLDLKMVRSKKYPSLAAYGQYGYNKTDFDKGNTLYNQSAGLSTGISFRFNVFNGQQQRIREKNAQLNIISDQERTLQIKAWLERDASNAYTDYAYKKRIVELQDRSFVAAELNFEQTKEMFKLGSITSIEFRTAQQNMLNVANNYNEARFNAKVAEYYLLQITGELVK